MNPARHFLGLFAVVGNWPNWESYFDLSRGGIRASFIALALSLPPLYLIAYAIGQTRAQMLGVSFVPPHVPSFIAIAAIFLLSFPIMALVLAMVFDAQDRFRAWVITRHWAVFFLSLVVGIMFGLTLLTPLPFMVANGVAFAAYLGLLAIDIRLLQKVVGLNWGAAILIGCVIVAVGLTLLMLGIQQINS
ncbi:hypothetical protein ACJ3XI_01920 [Litorimonas sp. RW-G-Af-16]|uniref:hypothetical protein n=1 Tax=Litorimonas sp. RW-G-Af-16 TaxID=3241168 RepID=UPI00390C4EBC